MDIRYFMVVLLMIGISSATNFNSCQSFNSPDTYTLTQDISSSGDCLAVNSNNVVIDCQGFTLTGDGTGMGIRTDPFSGAVVKNCRITNFGEGILSYGNSIILNNTIYNNTDGGIDATLNNPSSNVTLNTIHDNANAGIYAGGTLSDNTIYDNGIVCSGAPFCAGIYLTSDATITGGHDYGNYQEIFFDGSVLTASIDGLEIDNPNGNDLDYTNISLIDSISGESYMVNWTAPPSPPGGRTSFRNKTIEIDTLSGSPSITSIVWHWTAAESSGHNESSFAVYSNDGSWADTGASLSTVSNTLTLASFAPLAAASYSILEIVPPPPTVAIIAPIGSNLTTTATAFSFIQNFSTYCELSVNGTLLHNFTNPSTSVSFSDTTPRSCGDITNFLPWTVTCFNLQGNASDNATFVHTPVFDFRFPTPSNRTNINGQFPANVSVDAHCIPADAQIDWNGSQQAMSCTSTLCWFYNASRANGIYTWNASLTTNDPDVYFSNRYVFLSSGMPAGNVTVNITTPTWTDFDTYTTGFFSDWGPTALAILSYAFAWLFSRRIPQTLIMGGIGTFIAFLLTMNPVFIAASIFSMVLGLGYKQAVG